MIFALHIKRFFCGCGHDWVTAPAGAVACAGSYFAGVNGQNKSAFLNGFAENFILLNCLKTKACWGLLTFCPNFGAQIRRFADRPRRYAWQKFTSVKFLIMVRA
ncbi:MAG: hypothetical protein CSA68_04965 [Rhodobacterales bacterium]|nr:MAG: hypothetical protein CSA68_04965 [Rhodobacterales bacterium]